jgi:hypothetical protein
MPIESKTQHLQADPPRSRERGGVAACLRHRIGRQPIGQVQPGQIQAQGVGEMAVHGGGEGTGMGGPQTHVFIEIEALPPIQQPLALQRRQVSHPAHQSCIEGLHGAARGET